MLSYREKKIHLALLRRHVAIVYREQLKLLMREYITDRSELKVFLWEFASLVEEAKAEDSRIKDDTAKKTPSRKVIHREIRELAKEARNFNAKLDSIHPRTWNRLEDEYISDTERLKTYHAPLKRIITYALERICFYDEEITRLTKEANKNEADLKIARYKSDTADYFTDLECQLADSFERHGAEVTISKNGTFAKALRIYREICGIPKYKPYTVSEARIHRIQERRKKHLHHK